MDARPPRLLVFELNEFSLEVLEAGVAQLGLGHLRRLLQLPRYETFTNDPPESDLLDPWVQWVSVHCGAPATEHQVHHMADVTRLNHPLIWEILNQEGISTGIVGPMNAAPSNHPKELFFYPDPWTFTADAHPDELKRMLEFPRYVATNYLHLSITRMAKGFLKFLGCFGKPELVAPATGGLIKMISQFARFRGGHFVAAAYLDYMAALKFVELRKKANPDFSLFFANLLAHAQHHHWTETDLRKNPEMCLVLRYLDKIAGLLIESLREGESLLLMNAISQENINLRKPWILYRQKDQEEFLRFAGILFRSVHSHMTYDAHVFFDSKEDCVQAKQILDGCTLQGSPLFLTELYPASPQKLFYRIQFTDEIPLLEQATFVVKGRSFRFKDHFERVVRRTGTHTQTGTVFTGIRPMPARMPNHQVFDRILEFYGIDSSHRKAAL